MKKIFSYISNNKAFAMISALFFLLYCVLSLVNHFNFRTSGYDLGIFNQAIYQYAHFKFAPNTVNGFPNLLADHFEIVMMLVPPFYYIFGSYTLLVFQILMIMFGGLGVYLYLNAKTNDKWMSLGGISLFYCFYGLFSAVLFDYHNNVTGIMFLPWLLLALHNDKPKKYYFYLALMILSKETFGLLAVFLGIYIAIFEKSTWKKHGIITTIIGIITFKLILSVVIPYFNNYQPYQHWVYEQLGADPVQAIQFIISHPLKSIGILFNDPIKTNSWGMLTITGGMIAVLNPLATLLFVPLLATKYFSSQENHWTYTYQYSVEFAPILGIFVPLVLIKTPGKLKYYLLTIFIAINILISISVPYSDFKMISDIFIKYFYYNPDTRDFQIAIKQIPSDASVSAENSFVSHLASREKIYQFPVIKDAQYLIIRPQHSQSTPLSTYQQSKEGATRLNNEYGFRLFYRLNSVEIYKR